MKLGNNKYGNARGWGGARGNTYVVDFYNIISDGEIVKIFSFTGNIFIIL